MQRRRRADGAHSSGRTGVHRQLVDSRIPNIDSPAARIRRPGGWTDAYHWELYGSAGRRSENSVRRASVP
jgi:hypothetical protein